MELQQVQREAQQELEGPKDVSGKSDMLLSLQRFGPSDGTRWMFREETEAADLALSTGLYRVWRNSLVFDCVRKRGVYVSDNGLRLESYNECFRIGPRSRCFCGHSLTSHLQKKDDRESAQQLLLKELQPRSTDTHNGISPTAPMYRASSAAATRGERTGVAAGGKKPHHPRKLVGVDSCSECSCRSFAYIPSHPDAIDERWLAYRRGFLLEKWAAKCKCKHTHLEHKATSPFSCKSCGCSGYASAWECLICDGKWQDHQVFTEQAAERRSQGLSTGEDFRPLNEAPDLQRLLLTNIKKAPIRSASQQPQATRPKEGLTKQQNQPHLNQQQRTSRMPAKTVNPSSKAATRPSSTSSQTHNFKVAKQ